MILIIIMEKEVKHYAFTDKKGRQITRENQPTNPGSIDKKVGKAYAFFYCGGKTENISERLPYIKDKYETPSELDLNLVEGINNLNTKKDSALVEIVEQAKRQRMSHVLEADLPNAGNKKTADLLGDIMTGINYSLYDKKEPFYAGIVYKRGEKYIFRRE